MVITGDLGVEAGTQRFLPSPPLPFPFPPLPYSSHLSPLSLSPVRRPGGTVSCPAGPAIAFLVVKLASENASGDNMYKHFIRSSLLCPRP